MILCVTLSFVVSELPSAVSSTIVSIGDGLFGFRYVFWTYFSRKGSKFTRSLLKIPVLLFASYLIHSNVRYDVPSRPGSGAATPNPAATEKQTTMQLFKRIDFLGCFLLAGWVGAALIAISLNINSTATNAWNWSDPVIIALFTTSAVLFVLFLFVELKWAAEPVMPFELLVSRTPVAVAINNFVLSMANFAIVSVPAFIHWLCQSFASVLCSCAVMIFD